MVTPVLRFFFNRGGRYGRCLLAIKTTRQRFPERSSSGCRAQVISACREFDRLAFLQRQTTNDVTLLSPSRSILTVLTNPAGRILDALLLIHESDEGIGMLTLPGQAGETSRYLKSRIFFRDQVSLTDASSEVAQFDLGGPAAPGLLAGLGIPVSPEPGEVLAGKIEGVTVQVIGTPGFSRAGYRLLVHTVDCERLEAALVGREAIQLSEANYHILRVENGLPAAGSELTGDYTPLEVGLETTISTTKGCYTGQEVIARQMNYDKVTQHLVVLRLQAPGVRGERAWGRGPAGGVAHHSRPITPVRPIGAGSHQKTVSPTWDECYHRRRW